jgi:hypothetical protein
VKVGQVDAIAIEMNKVILKALLHQPHSATNGALASRVRPDQKSQGCQPDFLGEHE